MDFRRLVFLTQITLVSLLALPAAAEPLEVLFLGNSFTHRNGGPADTNGVSGIPNRFQQIAVDMGEDDPVVRMYAPSGTKLYSKVTDTNVLALINDPARDWDYVVLQEYSTYPTELSALWTQRFYTAVQDLETIITNANPNAQTLLYMTWARADAHSIYDDNPEVFDDRLHMQAQLRKHYDAAAEAAGVEVVPVGNGWDRVFAADETLGDSLYGSDLYHQSPNGAYFNALVFYSYIYGTEPTGLTAPSDADAVSQADADALMPLAWATVQPTEILFIGNSFTHRGGGLASRFQQLIDVSGDPAPLSTQVAFSGWSLKTHWTDGDQDARNAINDTNRQWDAVALQEYSTGPTDLSATRLSDFFTYGDSFNTEITNANATTRTLLFETWARSESNTTFWSDPGNAAALVDRPTMQNQLRTNYNQLAQDTGATVAPCGDAWETAHLVDRSVPLYASDEYHQSDTGAYLNALVFYATLFSRDPRGLPPPADIDPADAAFLQKVARAEVLGGVLVHNPPAITLVAPTNDPATVTETNTPLAITASLTDDGVPGTGLTSAWSQVSGPGNALFADAAATNTTVQFDTDGTYVVRITASDGDLQSSLDFTVYVGTNGVPQAGDLVNRWLFDFGPSYITTGNWNTISSGTTAGMAVENALDTNGASTDIDLEILDRFSNANGSGNNDGTVYPATAQRDTYYVTGTGSVGSESQAVVRLQGLQSDLLYSVTIFASRYTSSTNRITRYTIGGQTAYLDPAGNTSNIVTISDIEAPSGQIELRIDPFNDAGALQEYGYLGVLDLRAYAADDSPADTDGDELPDAWETQYFGGATNATPDAMASNQVNTVKQAYILGLDPTDTNAAFAVTATHTADPHPVISWSPVTGRVYEVQWATNLVDGFQTLATNTSESAFTDSVHSADSEGFYRLRVRMAD